MNIFFYYLFVGLVPRLIAAISTPLFLLLLHARKNHPYPLPENAAQGDEYFPVAVAFECERSFCGFSVQSVVLATDGTPVEYDLQTVIGTASYEFNAA